MKPRVAWQPPCKPFRNSYYKIISYRTSGPITPGNSFKLWPIRYNPIIFVVIT